MAVQREYLSPNEIAEVLGVSPFTIRRYIKLGELRAVKLLGGFRVHRDDLQRFLKAHEVNPVEEELQPEEATPAGPLPNTLVRLPTPPLPRAVPEEPPEAHLPRKRAVKQTRRK